MPENKGINHVIKDTIKLWFGIDVEMPITLKHANNFIEQKTYLNPNKNGINAVKKHDLNKK